MQFLALASDYDGTLADQGRVAAATLAALESVRASGRKLLLVSGRQLEDLHSIFPAIGVFDSVVAENGAVLYNPRTRTIETLGDQPPRSFLELLRQRGVQPLSVGRVVVATSVPHEKQVFRAIEELGLELDVIFNKGAVMVLPAGIDKAAGMKAALGALALSPDRVVAVGDAENDESFLALCGCGVAVANALPMLKARADLVTRAGHGDGVREVIDLLLKDRLPCGSGP